MKFNMFDLLGRVLLKCSSGEAEKLQAKHPMLGYSTGIVITKKNKGTKQYSSPGGFIVWLYSFVSFVEHNNRYLQKEPIH